MNETHIAGLITAAEARRLLGGISAPTLWRRMRFDPRFPRPIQMHRRNYFRPEEIAAYVEVHISAAL